MTHLFGIELHELYLLLKLSNRLLRVSKINNMKYNLFHAICVASNI